MTDALSVDDFAAQLAQADQPEQPTEVDSDPAEMEAQESEGQPEGDEAEAQPEGEAEGDEGQDEQPEEPASSEDRVIKWTTANGEAYEVTEKELQAGYMRQADYTQKAQAVAEERKQVQQLAQQKVQEVQAFAQEYGQLHVIQQELAGYANVDWQSLQATDPALYQQHVTRVLLLQNQERALNSTLDTKRQQFTQQQQQQAAIDWQEANQKAAQTLAEHIKGFDTDAGVREKAIATMTKAGREYGFTAEELGQVVDGRMLKVLHDAAQFRALQAQKPQAVKKVAALPQKAPAANRTPPTKTEQLVKTAVSKKGLDIKTFASALAATSKR